MSKKPDSKPVTHLDPAPKKSHAATATDSPLHSTDDQESNPNPNPGLPRDPRTALDRERADQIEPEIDPIPPQPAGVPVPDPDPQPEAHYPSGADEIMRRHRLIDPEEAKVKAKAEAEGDAEKKGEGG